MPACLAQSLSLPNGPGLLQGRLRSLEAVPVYPQLPHFGFECLSRNAQLNGGAGWPSNHSFGFPESGFEDLSFAFDKVGNQRSSRRSRFGSHVREPGLIHKESLPFKKGLGPKNTEKAGVGGSTPSLATIIIAFVFNQRNRLYNFVLFLICRHCMLRP